MRDRVDAIGQSLYGKEWLYAKNKKLQRQILQGLINGDTIAEQQKSPKKKIINSHKYAPSKANSLYCKICGKGEASPIHTDSPAIAQK